MCEHQTNQLQAEWPGYDYYDHDWLQTGGDLDDFIFYDDMDSHVSER